jgi:hypothetical protein
LAGATATVGSGFCEQPIRAADNATSSKARIMRKLLLANSRGKRTPESAIRLVQISSNAAFRLDADQGAAIFSRWHRGALPARRDRAEAPGRNAERAADARYTGGRPVGIEGVNFGFPDVRRLLPC